MRKSIERLKTHLKWTTQDKQDILALWKPLSIETTHMYNFYSSSYWFFMVCSLCLSYFYSWYNIYKQLGKGNTEEWIRQKYE